MIPFDSPTHSALPSDNQIEALNLRADRATPHWMGDRMNPRLTEQLEQVQKDLAQNLAEVESIGESLIEVGIRLKQEPWKRNLGFAESSFPAGGWTHPGDADMLEALDRNRISWLLEDIRILRRRETELKRLAVA
jgi:hypothetical protein